MKLIKVNKSFERKDGGSVSNFVYKVNPAINYFLIEGGTININVTPYYNEIIANAAISYPLQLNVPYNYQITLTEEEVNSTLIESIELHLITVIGDELDCIPELV